MFLLFQYTVFHIIFLNKTNGSFQKLYSTAILFQETFYLDNNTNIT